jgi:hypothetical protein
MQTTINYFIKSIKPYAVINECDRYSLTINEVWEQDKQVGSIQKPKNAQKFIVSYKGKTLGKVWNFVEAKYLLETVINKKCYLNQID